MRITSQIAMVVLVACLDDIAQCGVIHPETQAIEVLAGSRVSMLWLVEDVQDPLFGYSLQLEPIANQGSIGSVTVDVNATNFFEPRNLIMAGGGEINSALSIIQPSGVHGIFMSANITDANNPIVPHTGINDVLAEVVWDISQDALGTFTFELGQATVLSDPDGFAVPFEGRSLVITVVPAVPTTALSLGTLAVLSHRRRCA
ncbi:MAG: hypothetical protein ACF8MF_02200 [Phycisphaerales bacterium JB052]